MREELRLPRLHPGHMRGNQLIAVAPHSDIARRNGNGVKRRRHFSSRLSRAAKRRSPGSRDRLQSSTPGRRGRPARAAKRKEAIVGNERGGRGSSCVCASVSAASSSRNGSPPLRLALFKCGQPLLELGICGLGVAHGARARKAISGNARASDGRGRECEQGGRCAPTATPARERRRD